MKIVGHFEAFMADVKNLACRLKPFEMPKLEVRRIGRFTALCLAAPSPQFQNLAGQCVEVLDSHRAPEDEAARRKRAAGRTPRQIQNIERWGYPLVFEDWRFHMTLSNAVDNENLVRQAEIFFAEALENTRQVAELCVFIETEPGADFILTERVRFG